MRETMQRPIEVSADLDVGAGYVMYLADREVAGTLDIWHDGQVAADLDDEQNVIGIEVLGFDDEQLGTPRSSQNRTASGSQRIFRAS